MENKGHKLELSAFRSWEKEKIKRCEMKRTDEENFLNTVLPP